LHIEEQYCIMEQRKKGTNRKESKMTLVLGILKIAMAMAFFEVGLRIVESIGRKIG